MEINGHYKDPISDESSPVSINSLPLHPRLIPTEENTDGNFELYLFQLEKSLKIMLEQSKTIYAELDQTLLQLQSSNSYSQPSQDEAKSDIDILKSLRAGFNTIQIPPYTLKLSSTIGQVLYKNKPFSLKLKLSSMVDIPVGKIVLRIRVFTYELPPKEIKHSMKGEAVLVNSRTKELENPKTIKFKRVSFTEVSSRYPEKKVIMLVSVDDRNDIKPLIIDGIQVKSRMPNHLTA